MRRLGYSVGYRGDHVQLVLAAHRLAVRAEGIDVAGYHRIDRAVLESLARTLAEPSDRR